MKESPLMKVFRATIAYDGTGFSGVAEQITKPEAVKIRTVIGELRPIVEVISQSKATINVSGRTDKGVHAREQVVSRNSDLGLYRNRVPVPRTI